MVWFSRPPLSLDRAAWLDVFKKALAASARHNLPLISAGVAFFTLLALFPALSAIVALYGLFSDPKGVASLIDLFEAYAPTPVTDMAREQVQRLISADTSKLALHGAVSIAVALWSAQQGARSFLRALTIVNERGRRRGFWGRYAAGGAVTLGAVTVALVVISTFTIAPILFDRLGADADMALQVLRPVVLLAVIALSAMALYRWGPARRAPSWRWVWPGAVVASLVWILVTIGFSYYVDVFTPWRAVYGVLSSVFVLMLWLFLSTYIFLCGAEINAQLERLCSEDKLVGCGANTEPAPPANANASAV